MICRVLIHDALYHRWLCFKRPIKVMVADTPVDVLPLLSEVQKQVNQGYHAAGFISYEAASAFDAALKTHPLDDFPVAWFGLFSEPQSIRLSDLNGGDYTLGSWSSSVSRQQYEEGFHKIHSYLRDGDTYQVNYAFQQRADFSGDPLSYFLQLICNQQCDYGAYIELDDFTICSASPELFFSSAGKSILTRPMKGTVSRGRSFDEDQQQKMILMRSSKDRAENVMIVDMIRNDLGRIADPGSVQVKSLFDIEQYPSVFQMTSTVTARTNASVSSVFQALFPCASITGAPKPRTMEIIRELEKEPRKVYSGSIGFITPEQRSQFNVAIRTALVDKKRGRVNYGVGGGLLWDSDVDSEYNECAVKTSVLTLGRPEFQLLETLLWNPDQTFVLLDRHLRRMRRSANYFNRPFHEKRIRRLLNEKAGLFPHSAQKVRLLLFADGSVRIENHPFQYHAKQVIRLRMADHPVQSENVFLFHKTTHRQVYDGCRTNKGNADGILLWNEREEITETAIYNVAVKMRGRWLTPPVSCGLLGGIYREWLLEQNEIEESVVTKAGLFDMEELAVMNSVRGWQKAILLR